MPMGQMPVLEINGHRIAQSVAIARYIAKEAGLTGTNDFENLLIDSTVDTINELRSSKCFTHLPFITISYIDVFVSEISLAYLEPDENLKKQKTETMINETIPFCLGKLEEMAKENNGYLVASKVRRTF